MAMEQVREEEEEAAEETPERVWQSREVQWSAASGLLLAIGFVVEQVSGNESFAVALWIVATFAGV